MKLERGRELEEVELRRFNVEVKTEMLERSVRVIAQNGSRWLKSCRWLSSLRKRHDRPGVVVHACNRSTWEVEA
jgi:hypothetical protein